MRLTNKISNLWLHKLAFGYDGSMLLVPFRLMRHFQQRHQYYEVLMVDDLMSKATINCKTSTSQHDIFSPLRQSPMPSKLETP